MDLPAIVRNQRHDNGGVRESSLLVALDIHATKAYTVEGLWKESRTGRHKMVAIELLFDKKKTQLTRSEDLLWFWLEPYTLSGVRVDLGN